MGQICDDCGDYSNTDEYEIYGFKYNLCPLCIQERDFNDEMDGVIIEYD